MTTKEMIIKFCRDPASLPYFNIDGAAIERVSQVNVLGVTLSSDLSWNAHVDGIVSKARTWVFLIYQLKRAGIGRCDLVRIYISVIRPVVEYACIGVNHPAIVREIPHFDVFPAFPHFSENVPHFWLYFEKQIFLIIVIILGARKKLCA